jgi:hypothetical protein
MNFRDFYLYLLKGRLRRIFALLTAKELQKNWGQILINSQKSIKPVCHLFATREFITLDGKIGRCCIATQSAGLRLNLCLHLSRHPPRPFALTALHWTFHPAFSRRAAVAMQKVCVPVVTALFAKLIFWINWLSCFGICHLWLNSGVRPLTWAKIETKKPNQKLPISDQE